MDKIEKLFRKISKKERKIINTSITLLRSGKIESLNIIKLKTTNLYRMRIGKIRIIFHSLNNEIVINDIRLRNNNTYKNLR